MNTSKSAAQYNSRSQTAAESEIGCARLDLNHRITLVCFGASGDIEIRLKGLKKHCQGDQWQDILHDPYVLLDIILDELYLQVSQHVRALTAEFGEIENVSCILSLALQAPLSSQQPFSRYYKPPVHRKWRWRTPISPFYTI